MASIAITAAITAGGLALQYLMSPRIKQEPIEKGKLDDVRITSSDYGTFIPRVWGRARIGGNIIWSNGVQTFISSTPSGGGKGVPQAPATRTYVYKSSFAVLVARGEVSQWRRMWADNQLITNNANETTEYFEAEDGTLSGGATEYTSGTFSGSGWVGDLGNGGQVVFDTSGVAEPDLPNSGDPDEIALSWTRIEIYYKCSAALSATVQTDSSLAVVSFPATADEWTVQTVHISGFADSVTIKNASAAAPDVDFIAVEKYYVIEVIGEVLADIAPYSITGNVRQDVIYPPDLDDPSGYYNNPIPAAASGLTSLVPSIPGELIRQYSGTDDQAQDSAIVAYLESKYGTGQGVLRTPAFRNRAYVMFENRTLKQARVENLTFEAVWNNANVNTVLADLLEDVGITSGYYDLTATTSATQIGFVESTTGSRRGLIENLERYHQFRIAERDGEVVTIANTATSAGSIPYENMRAHADGDAMPAFDAEVIVKDRSQMAREVRVSVMNPSLDYRNETVAAAVFASVEATETRQYAFPIVDTTAGARTAAEKLVLQEYAEDRAIEFTAMPIEAKWSVGDVITISLQSAADGSTSNVVCRIEKQQVQLPFGVVRYSCVAVNPFNWTVFQTDTTDVSTVHSSLTATYTFPRNAVVIPINSQAVREQDKGRLGVYLAVCGRGRGVAKNFTLMRETAEDNFSAESIIDVPAVAGLADGTLAANPSTPTTLDETNTLDIWFFDKIELESVTQDDLDKNPTLNLLRVGNEWIRFKTATAQTLEDNSPYRSKWRVEDLWREQISTEGADTSHAAGEYCVLWSPSIIFYPLEIADVGENIVLKAVSNGQDEANAPTTTISAFSPVNNTVGFATWIDYATGWSATPTFVETIASGDVWQYEYNGTTLYRLVPSGSAEDAFYTTFSTPTLSGLVVQKEITV